MESAAATATSMGRTWPVYPKRIALAAAFVLLASCSGGGGSSGGASPAPPAPPPPPPSSSTLLDTADETAAFLMKGSFGASFSEIEATVGQDRTDWLQAEFSKPPTLLVPRLTARVDQGETLTLDDHSHLFWESMITADDQLRQRMVFALSQIVVASDGAGGSDTRSTAYYIDVLSENAFGNYRDVLEGVTFTPVMSRWLTYLRNRKGDPVTGRMPDENCAREIMQLFSIGLIELNMDGTPRLDASGQAIETYDNDDVIGLARVFTGLSFKGTSFGSTNGKAPDA